MAFSLQAAANNMSHRIAMEHVREGHPRPVVVWTGNHQLRGRQLWIEVKIYGEDNTMITGWTNGEERDGFITFEEV